MKRIGEGRHGQMYSNTGIGNAPSGRYHQNQAKIQKQIDIHAENQKAQQENLAKRREQLQKKFENRERKEGGFSIDLPIAAATAAIVLLGSFRQSRDHQSV